MKKIMIILLIFFTDTVAKSRDNIKISTRKGVEKILDVHVGYNYKRIVLLLLSL